MFLARVETRNFDFWAFDQTEEGAKEQLRLAWLQHRVDTAAWLPWSELVEDVFTVFMRSGDTFVNRELYLSCNTPNAYQELNECEECLEVFSGEVCDCDTCRCHGETNCPNEKL